MLVIGISAGKPHRLQQWFKFFGARLSFVPFPHFEGQTFDYVYICVHSCVWTWRFGWKNRNLPVATNVSQRGICHRCVSTPICQPPPFQPQPGPVHSELLAMYAETIFLRSGAATKQYPEVFQDGGGVFPRSWIHRPKPTRAILPSSNHLSLYRHRLHLKWILVVLFFSQYFQIFHPLDHFHHHHDPPHPLTPQMTVTPTPAQREWMELAASPLLPL